MFPPWAPFFSAVDSRVTAARNKFRSATVASRHLIGIARPFTAHAISLFRAMALPEVAIHNVRYPRPQEDGMTRYRPWIYRFALLAAFVVAAGAPEKWGH